MEEMKLKSCLRSLKEQTDSIQILLYQSQAQITHPTMQGLVLKTYVRTLLDDLEYHSTRMMEIMHESGIDQEKKDDHG